MQRKILVILSVILIVGGIKTCGYLVDSKKAPDSHAVIASAKLVSTVTVENGDVATGISITGKLTARNKVELFSEVGGVFLGSGKEFKEGVRFSKGEVMLHIENEELRMNVVSQRSAMIRSLAQMIPDMRIDLPVHSPKWEAFLSSIDIEKNLPTLPEMKEEKELLFLSGRNILDQYYNIRSQEVRLAKYTITAPFNGVLSNAIIDPGTNVRVGQKLGEFIQPGDLELEAAVGVADAIRVNKGLAVQLWSGDIPGEWSATVIRVSEAIDKSTQTIKIFASVSGAELRDGMYMRGMIQTDTIPNAYKMHGKFLLSGDMIYTVGDSALKKVKVDIVAKNEEEIVLRGLPNGTKVLNEQLAGAYQGMPVVTNGTE